MQTATNQAKAKAAIEFIQTIGEAIKEAGAIPSGHLYAILMPFGITMPQYEILMSGFEQAGKIKEVGGIIYWIDNPVPAIKPQPQDRIEWETDVCYEMEVLGEMTTSDAQGQMMIRENVLDDCYNRNMTAIDTANAIIDSCTIKS